MKKLKTKAKLKSSDFASEGVAGITENNRSLINENILNDEEIEIVWIDEETHIKAVELIKECLDKNHSLCDAVSFVIMQTRGIAESLTTDKHFEQEGFIRLLK